jgi:hypothetical protein
MDLHVAIRPCFRQVLSSVLCECGVDLASVHPGVGAFVREPQREWAGAGAKLQDLARIAFWDRLDHCIDQKSL